jgi:hypothetical protein
LQLAANKTIFIASNKTLAVLPGIGTDAPIDDSLTNLSATTDIAPTVLRQLGIADGGQDFDGIALQGPTAVRQLAAITGADKASIVLSWTLGGMATAPVQVLRDGKLVATRQIPSFVRADREPCSSVPACEVGTSAPSRLGDKFRGQPHLVSPNYQLPRTVVAPSRRLSRT